MLQELIDNLNEAMQNIQTLQIQPTENNCNMICNALKAIRKAAQIGVDMDKAANSGTTEEIKPEETEN